jgi:CheY-like chemotaxis protein
LIVDDEHSMRRALRRLFENAGWAVQEGRSGEEALQLVTETSGAGIDALVSDIVMPGLSGLELYDKLVGAAPSLAHRVIFLTGAAHDPKVHALVEQRGVPLVSKLDDLQIVVDAARLAVIRAA